MARVIGPDPQGEDRRGLPDLLPGLRLEELLREVQERIAEVVVAQDRLQGLLDAVLAIGEGLELRERRTASRDRPPRCAIGDRARPALVRRPLRAPTSARHPASAGLPALSVREIALSGASIVPEPR